MHFEEVDRVPFSPGGPYIETLNRWYGEGLPWGMSVNDYFNYDKFEGVPIDFGPIPRFITRTLEEDEHYRIVTGWRGFGIKVKELKTSESMPYFLEFPVKSHEDFEKMKARYDPADERRYPLTWSEELFEYYSTTDRPVQIGGFPFTGVFSQARWMVGLERLLVSFYRDPEFVRDMFNFFTDFQCEVLRSVLPKVKTDWAIFFEDMAYKTGPMIGPNLFREFMLPCYKKLTETLRNNGVDIIFVDTDGNANVLIPLFLEAGVNGISPLEVAAGVDAVPLREKYGKKLLLMGNVDKRALALGKKAIKREIERVLPLMKDGGFIPSIDHAVAHDVSFENFTYYVSLLKP